MPPPKAYLGYRAELRNEQQAVIVNHSRQIVVDSILMLVYGRDVQYWSLVADDGRWKVVGEEASSSDVVVVSSCRGKQQAAG